MSESPPNDPVEMARLLGHLLGDTDAEVRRTAARSLGKLGRIEAVEPLVRGLHDADPVVREYSAVALGQLGEAAREQAAMPLAQRLRDPSDAVKRAAAGALGWVGGTAAAVEVVIEALESRDAGTRRAAADALGALEAQSAYAALAASLQDDDPLVRQHALSALGELADRRAVPLIRERLRHDPAPNVRSEAAYRLGKLGTAAHLEVLRAAAAGDRAPVVRWWATWAAEQISSVGGPD